MSWLRRSGARDEAYVKKAKKIPIVLPPRIEQVVPPKPRRQKVRILYDDDLASSLRSNRKNGSPVIDEIFATPLSHTFFSPATAVSDAFLSPASSTYYEITPAPPRLSSGTVVEVEQDPVSLRYTNSDYPFDPDVEAVVDALNGVNAAQRALLSSQATQGSSPGAEAMRSETPLYTIKSPNTAHPPSNQPWRPATEGGVLHLMDRSEKERERVREEQRLSYKRQMKLTVPPLAVRFLEIEEDELYELEKKQQGQLHAEETSAPTAVSSGNLNERTAKDVPRKESLPVSEQQSKSLILTRMCTMGVTMLEYVEGVVEVRVLQLQKQLADPPEGIVVDPYEPNSANGGDDADEEVRHYYHPHPFTYAELVENVKLLPVERRREMRAVLLHRRTHSPDIYGTPVRYEANPANAHLTGYYSSKSTERKLSQPSKHQVAQASSDKVQHDRPLSASRETGIHARHATAVNSGGSEHSTPLQPDSVTIEVRPPAVLRGQPRTTAPAALSGDAGNAKANGDAVHTNCSAGSKVPTTQLNSKHQLKSPTHVTNVPDSRNLNNSVNGKVSIADARVFVPSTED